jgi:hypothetical protein
MARLVLSKLVNNHKAQYQLQPVAWSVVRPTDILPVSSPNINAMDLNIY